MNRAYQISEEDFIDGARSAVLQALDGYMQDLTRSERAKGSNDADLPELFKALDAHMRRVAARFNDPESQEVGSAFFEVLA